MKLAIPTGKNNAVFEHFGHCQLFKIVTINENNEVAGSEIFEASKELSKNELAIILKNKGVTMLLVGGIGEGAIDKMSAAGLEVLKGCKGDTDQLVQDYIAGKIEDSGSSCNHHDHEHHHNHEHGHSCNCHSHNHDYTLEH